jgi:hypothetical protein
VSQTLAPQASSHPVDPPAPRPCPNIARSLLLARGKVLFALRVSEDGRMDFGTLDEISRALTIGLDAINRALALERGRR